MESQEQSAADPYHTLGYFFELKSAEKLHGNFLLAKVCRNLDVARRALQALFQPSATVRAGVGLRARLDCAAAFSGRRFGLERGGSGDAARAVESRATSGEDAG